MHYSIGNLGHLSVVTAFVTSLLSTFAYWKATTTSETNKSAWLQNGRALFYAHAISILAVVATLFIIIQQHYFEYHYAYSHSDSHLPLYYLVSTFWNGQEGSFLLWMFWHVVIGLVLIKTQKTWEAPSMVVFTLVQAFLTSMILGVVIPGINLKLGSSPFILLRDAINDPIFKLQPDFIPKDGNGLNPLLQNYWMVIHPPTLFLGFGLALPPFAFCMAGLWQKKYVDWIRPALPWALLAGGILGLGILMGGYWAYETLNFGGYWNWDPVENAVYVPWLVLVASIHTMMSYKNTGSGLRTSIILVISVFILLLYQTFLTRSGILGDASVHSFTDLGLSGQLMIYLLSFLFGSILLCIVRWRGIPSSDKEISTYSREFWIFLGVLTLCIMGIQVLGDTSKPVYNKIVNFFGGNGNKAPGDALFYSKIQLWFAVILALLSGTAQFFWWKKIDRQKLKSELTTPLMFTLILFALIVVAGKVYEPRYLILTLAGTYLIVSNLKVLLALIKINPKLSGGAIAHIGVGMMLIGVMFSAGYSRVVSLNNSGMLISKELPTEFNRDNLLLFINEPRSMAGYDLEYRGERFEFRHKSGYVNKNHVTRLPNPYRVVANQDIIFKGEKIYAAKDTFEIFPENTYYEIELRKNGEFVASLFPRVQINSQMGGFVASPDIKRKLTRDLYTHVSLPMNKEEEPEWGKLEELKIKIGEEFYLNSKYASVLEQVVRIGEIDGEPLSPDDVAVQAKIKIQGEHEIFYAEPIFIIREKRQVGRIFDEVDDLGVKLALLNILPDTNEFLIGINARQKDWVVIKALEKPFINVLWLGTGVLMVGFAVAMVRRYREYAERK